LGVRGTFFFFDGDREIGAGGCEDDRGYETGNEAEMLEAEMLEAENVVKRLNFEGGKERVGSESEKPSSKLLSKRTLKKNEQLNPGVSNGEEPDKVREKARRESEPDPAGHKKKYGFQQKFQDIDRKNKQIRNSSKDIKTSSGASNSEEKPSLNLLKRKGDVNLYRDPTTKHTYESNPTEESIADPKRLQTEEGLISNLSGGGQYPMDTLTSPTSDLPSLHPTDFFLSKKTQNPQNLSQLLPEDLSEEELPKIDPDPPAPIETLNPNYRDPSLYQDQVLLTENSFTRLENSENFENFDPEDYPSQSDLIDNFAVDGPGENSNFDDIMGKILAESIGGCAEGKKTGKLAGDLGEGKGGKGEGGEGEGGEGVGMGGGNEGGRGENGFMKKNEFFEDFEEGDGMGESGGEIRMRSQNDFFGGGVGGSGLQKSAPRRSRYKAPVAVGDYRTERPAKYGSNRGARVSVPGSGQAGSRNGSEKKIGSYKKIE
jgi:hypothetical protein